MKPTIGRHCPKCNYFSSLEAHQGNYSCPNCTQHWGKLENLDNLFDEGCPFCPCRQFYLSKNFNQALGCAVMFLGIIFVPWTYGLSLPFFWLIDLVLYKRVKSIVNCYRCGTEFHNFNYPKRLKTFMHHIGLKYDKYR